MRRLAILTALLLAPLALAESFILPVGTTGLLKADFALVLYEHPAGVSGVAVDLSSITVTECTEIDCSGIGGTPNGRYEFAGLPDAEPGSGTWYELTAEPNGVPVRYAWPIQTRTPQSTSAVVSYRVPATVEIAAGDTDPPPELSVAGLAADPSGAAVTFSLWRSNGVLAIEAVPASLKSWTAHANGTWSATFVYLWTTAETAALADGSYYGRFRVTFSGGPPEQVMTLPPAPGRLVVRVHR